jgi:hypothetical protein
MRHGVSPDNVYRVFTIADEIIAALPLEHTGTRLGESYRLDDKKIKPYHRFISG